MVPIYCLFTEAYPLTANGKVHRAGLPALEFALGARVLAAKHEIIRNEVAREVSDALETVRSILSARSRAPTVIARAASQ